MLGTERCGWYLLRHCKQSGMLWDSQWPHAHPRSYTFYPCLDQASPTQLGWHCPCSHTNDALALPCFPVCPVLSTLSVEPVPHRTVWTKLHSVPLCLKETILPDKISAISVSPWSFLVSLSQQLTHMSMRYGLLRRTMWSSSAHWQTINICEMNTIFWNYSFSLKKYVECFQ